MPNKSCQISNTNNSWARSRVLGSKDRIIFLCLEEPSELTLQIQSQVGLSSFFHPHQNAKENRQVYHGALQVEEILKEQVTIAGLVEGQMVKSGAQWKLRVGDVMRMLWSQAT